MLDRPDNVNVYVLYAQEDEDLKDELERHLSVLQRQGYIDVWHAGKISVGSDFTKVQSEYMAKAHVILLLISANFLAPECYNNLEPDLRKAFDRQKDGSVKIIPVILKECLWQFDLLESLKPLPPGGHAIRSSYWESPDKAFTKIAVELQHIAKDFLHAKDRIKQHLKDFASEFLEPVKPRASVAYTPPPREEQIAKPEKAPTVELTDRDSQAHDLILKVFDIMRTIRKEQAISQIMPLLHASLMPYGQLDEDFKKYNLLKALERVGRYKYPVELTEKATTGRNSLGVLSNKENGEEWRYAIAKVEKDGGLPAYVRIFFPEDGMEPKISGLSI